MTHTQTDTQHTSIQQQGFLSCFMARLCVWIRSRVGIEVNGHFVLPSVISMLLLISCLALFWSVIATFPPLRIGIWMDAELVFIAQCAFTACALVALGLHPALHRLQLTRLKIIILSVFVFFIVCDTIGPNANNPRQLSIFGLPQTNEGYLFYLQCLCFGACLYQLLKDGYKKALLINVVLAALVIVLFTVLNHPSHHIVINEDWCPYVFSAFIAFIGIALIGISTLVPLPKYRYAFTAFGIIVIALSFNKTVQLALVPYLFMVIIHEKTKFKLSRHHAAIMLAGLPIGIIIFEVLLSSPDRMLSLDSRVKLLHVIYQEFLHRPERLLTGFGFGHFTDTILGYFTRIGVALFQNNQFQPSWDCLDRIDFHCHHQVIEALSQHGIIGALLVLLAPIWLIYRIPDKHFSLTFLYLLLWVTISSTWFTLVIHIPFLTFAVVAILYARNESVSVERSYSLIEWLNQNIIPKIYQSSAIDRCQNILLRLICLLCAIVFMWATCVQSYISWLYTKPHFSMLAEKINPPSEITPGLLAKHNAINGLHGANYLKTLLENSKIIPTNEVTLRELETFKHAGIAAGNISLMMRVIVLDIMTQEKSPQWELYLKDTLRTYPTRLDLAIPYVAQLLNVRKLKEAAEFVAYLESCDANNPVAHWFKGMIMLEMNHDVDDARKLLRHALDHGIEKWTVVDPHFKELIVGK